MVEKLRELLQNSHTDVYHYPVACILEMKDGKQIPGVNIETSSPAAGICAERNALYTALTLGYQKGDVVCIHLMNQTEKACYPCFICRQALVDFCLPTTEVVTYSYSGKIVEHITLSELTPYPFSNDDLKEE